MDLDKGYIQVYTGNGKGKTTAALGLAIRCLCGGYKVFFGQFMKGQDYCELKATGYFENLTMEQFGSPDFIKGKPSRKDICLAQKGLKRMEEIIKSEAYDMVVFDEINTAIFLKLLNVKDVLKVIEQKPVRTEIVLTGRYAPKELLDKADLVTEMKEVKHYYNKGVLGRKGIER